MAAYVVWLVLAFALVIVELVTGTFYVLMIALAFGAGGLAALAGFGTAMQFVIAAVVGAVAIVALRRSRFGGRRGSSDPAVDPEQTLDIGQVVHVDVWRDSKARVMYRGTQWDAVLAAGESPSIGNFYIREVHGSRLTLSAHRP